MYGTRIRVIRPHLVSMNLLRHATHVELRYAGTHQYVIQPGESRRVPCGIAVDLQPDTIGIIAGHPILQADHIVQRNRADVVGQAVLPDAPRSDERDELHVVVRNLGPGTAYLLPAEIFAVLYVIAPINSFTLERA